MPTPDIVNENRHLFQEYVRSAHAILSTLLNSVGDCLQLPPAMLANIHRISAVGTDQVRLTRTKPPHTEHGGIPEHRDASSMTLLFNKQSGLQILPPGASSQWCYVRPISHHAIVNLGDAMVTFTNGLLRSNPHRVVAPYGSEVEQTRYSLVYFMRPENTAMMKRLEGSEMIPNLAEDEVEREITAEEWVNERFKEILAGNGVVMDSKHR
jgi:isopenicillin N synthase-like dioxygenase